MDGNTEIELSIVETKDREISIINEEWLKGRFLLWPPKHILNKPQKLLLKAVSANDWIKISDFKILQSGIRSIEEAKERLIFYSLYENSLDKIQSDEAIALKRKHPIDYITNNHFDYNSMFDKQLEATYTTSTPNTARTEISACILCGNRIPFDELLECLSCAKKMCCECDEMYHRHPKRVGHRRTALTLDPKCAGKATSSNAYDIVQSTVPTSNDKVVSGNIVTHSGVIPKPLKKTVIRRVAKNRDVNVKNFHIFEKPKNVQQEALSLERTLCNVCGKKADFKCLDCDLGSFCGECDKLYHLHPLRTKHQRTAIKLIPKDAETKNQNNNEFHNEIASTISAQKATSSANYILDLSDPAINVVYGRKATSNAYDIVDLSSPPTNNDIRVKVASENFAKNSVIPRPLGKTVIRRVETNRADITTNRDTFAKPRKTQQSTSSQESRVCNICGTAADFKCFDCAMELFCSNCDKVYHHNPVRSKHHRTKSTIYPEEVTPHDSLSSLKPTPSHYLPTSLNRKQSADFILNLPVIFEANAAVIDEEIVNLEDICDQQITELHNVGAVAQNTEMRALNEALNENRKKQVMSRKTLKSTNRIATKSVATKRIFSTLNNVQKDVRMMLRMLTKVKSDQVAIKTNLNAFKTEIANLAEIVTKTKENVKKTIEIDESFVMPSFPCQSIALIRIFNESCASTSYCDQVAVRFINLTSENIKDVGAAVKRIIEHMFKYTLLKLFSWTGQSSLNSEANQKESFSDLVGIVAVVRQAATLKLLDTEKVREASLKAVKDVIRRASQNHARQHAQ